MKITPYPELKHLFAIYLNQFWKQLYNWGEKTPNYQDVIHLYKHESGDERIMQAIKELELLLAQNLNEEDLHQMVHRTLGSALYVPSLEMTYQEWLSSVLEILKNSDNLSDLISNIIC
jgi:hypothetical protein